MEALSERDGPAVYDRCLTHTIRTTKRNATARAITQPLVERRSQLRAGVAAVESALQEQIEATADVQIIDWEGDDLIREVNGEAKKLDRRNPALGLRNALLPDGLEVVIARRGEAQATEMDTLLKRLDDVEERAPEFVAQYRPLLVAAIENTVTAAGAQKAAFEKVGTKRTDLDLLKARIMVEYEATYGALRSAFAANPRYVERYFASTGRRTSTSTTENEQESDDVQKDEAA